jgi:mannose-6-phosphate isomerase-like protein (cupin superfamily)
MTRRAVTAGRFSEDDLLVLSKEILDGQTIKSEDFYNDVYLDEIIDKPWGLEYRVYADMLVDVWRLSIVTGHSTSMHCHPRKNTVLICLDGNVCVNFIKASYLLSTGDLISIPKGVFHSTDSIGELDAELIEVETPRNKFDLIRARDKYGRDGQRYETEKSEKAIAPMRSLGSSAYGAKIRDADLDGSFAFTIVDSHEIDMNATADPRFAISLSLDDAIEQNIDVVSLSGPARQPARTSKPYLLVSGGLG